MKLSDLSDQDVILALLEHPYKLSDREVKIFNGFLTSLEDGAKLTKKQRDWVRDKFKMLDLLGSFDAENLASSGAGKKLSAQAEFTSQLRLDSMLGPKAVAPPPSSRRRFE